MGRPSVVFIRAIQGSGKTKILGDQGGSTGSGVVISADGYIVTNNHVVEEAKTIEVMLNDNREFKAKLVGADPTTDLAILKIESENLPHLSFGNSDSLAIGEWVVAIGNPFRLQSTVTAGIVSAKARNINILEQQGIESFIQTDAAVNPGNSGGALVNTSGELVGINTAIMTYSGRYEGFSFAIPSNLAQKIVFDIIDQSGNAIFEDTSASGIVVQDTPARGCFDAYIPYDDPPSFDYEIRFKSSAQETDHLSVVVEGVRIGTEVTVYLESVLIEGDIKSPL